MPFVALTYRERVARLREKKLEETRQKVAKGGYRNEDDHGVILPPEDWHWEPTPNHPNGGYYGPKACGENFRSLMESHPTYVDPQSALAGRYMVYMAKPGGYFPDFDYSHLKPDQEKYELSTGIGARAHFGPDLGIGLSLGWGGLLKKIRHYRGMHGPEKADFFDGEEDVVLGIQNWIRRTVAAIHEALCQETDPELKDNLREMATANEWLVDNPPRSLREACQWLAWCGMAARIYTSGAGGQLDELLRPYYERDVEAGVIDDEKAIYCIASLLLSDTRYYQLGGPAPDGRDQVSRVSYLILEAAHRLGASCNLTVRVHDEQDEEFFLQAVRHLCRERKGWPRFSGDKGLTEGFMRNGYPRELARQRAAVGCHWMNLPGREYTCNDCVKIPVAKVFEVAFWETMDDRSSEPSVAHLWARFQDHLRRAILCIAEGLDFHLEHQHWNAPEMVLNLLCHGTLEEGLDVSAGGVEFYNMCVDGTGLATVADSFAALEQRVEREGLLGWDEITRHLRSSYAGREGERVRLMMKGSERYGSGGSLGDEWALRVSRRFAELVKEKRTPGGRIMIPGWFSWSLTISMGATLGATPDGRKAGEPISHGANPNAGFRKDAAPTAMAKAVAAVQTGYGNTCPIQLDLDPGVGEDEESIRKIASLIKTHFELGGTLFNINVLDKETVLAARDDPWRYPDLIVRVTGFTAYFASLSPEFRQMVIDRIVAVT